MTASAILNFLQKEIHTAIVATVDAKGFPVTCAVDIMHYDENGLYFLTARGKSLYDRLVKSGFIALTGIKGKDTLHSVAVSLRGNVKEIGTERLSGLIELNPYMKEIYPTAKSQSALTVFCVYSGSGEWFDLSQKPIVRQSFTFGCAWEHNTGYHITSKCIGCGKCLAVCPQSCIDISCRPAVIKQEHCLHCGNCKTACPVQAVERRQI